MKTKRIIIGLKTPGMLKSSVTEQNVEFVCPKDIIAWDKKVIYTDSETLIIIVGNSYCERIARKIARKKKNGMDILLVRYSIHPLKDEYKALFDHHIERTEDDHISLITFLHDKTGLEKNTIEVYLSNHDVTLQEEGHQFRMAA